MSLKIKKSSLIFLIILSIIWYSVYVNSYPEKFKDINSNYPIIWKINTIIINIWNYVKWETVELTDKSKELYNEKLVPTITKAKNEINNTVIETKWKIDWVRKTLSWAEQTIDKAWKVIKKWQETLNEAGEVMIDFNKIWEWVMNSVNKDVVQ